MIEFHPIDLATERMAELGIPIVGISTGNDGNLFARYAPEATAAQIASGNAALALIDGKEIKRGPTLQEAIDFVQSLTAAERNAAAALALAAAIVQNPTLAVKVKAGSDLRKASGRTR